MELGENLGIGMKMQYEDKLIRKIDFDTEDCLDELGVVWNSKFRRGEAM
jgi:hypothetical protein